MTAATTTRSDAEIQRDVQEELKWEARVQPNEVGVIVKEGVVTLTGWVDSFIKKWAAERAALRVDGVQAVANDIEVRLNPADERTDGDVASAAARALQWDAVVPDNKIKLTVSNGWVTLKGEVEWEFQRRAAERAVRGLTGVRGVSNLITVRPSVEPKPGDLKRRITHALIRNAETDASHVDVMVHGGRVVLTGTVRTWAERQEAERVAWSAPGVTEVSDRIVIAP